MPLLAGLFCQFVHFAVLVRWRRRRNQRDVQIGLALKLFHPGPFFVVAKVIRDQFEHRVGQALHAHAQGQHFVVAGKGAGHIVPMNIFVQQCLRAGKPNGTRLNPFPHQFGHRLDLGPRRRVVGVTALAHHVGAHRAVGHLGRHVDRSGHGFQRIQILGKTLPLPVDTLGQCRPGNILYAFHQLDQKVTIFGFNRCKPDPAIAHHHGGNTVPARGCEHRIPSGLTVVMRVNVYPTRCNQQTGRVYLLLGLTSNLTGLADGRNAPVLHGNVTDKAGFARAV